MIATAAPMAVPPAEVADDPSAFDSAVESPSASRLTAPVALTATSRLTSTTTMAIVIAMAAATLTPPSEVSAAGACPLPESAAPDSPARVSAKPRWSAVSPSTPPAFEPDWPSPGAPAAEADASVVTEESEAAWNASPPSVAVS